MDQRCKEYARSVPNLPKLKIAQGGDARHRFLLKPVQTLIVGGVDYKGSRRVMEGLRLAALEPKWLLFLLLAIGRPYGTPGDTPEPHARVTFSFGTGWIGVRWIIMAPPHPSSPPSSSLLSNARFQNPVENGPVNLGEIWPR